MRDGRDDFLRDLCDNASDIIQSIDPHRRFLYVNRAWRETLGYSEEEAGKLNVLDVVHPDSRSRFEKMLEEIMAGEPGARIEADFITKDGQRIAVEGSASCRFKDGKPVSTRGIFRDISERKRTERLLAQQALELARSNAELEQFAYVASHDLQAPLRTIVHLADWIEDDLPGDPGPEARQHLDKLRIQVRRMQELTDDLLKYSRAGRASEEVRHVNTRELVAEIASLLAPPREFSVTAAPDLPEFETAKAALEQVFRNLIGNAISHHHRADGNVVVSAVDRGDSWQFSVADDGPGIPDESRASIFAMFHTLRSHGEAEGTGIGLALVKRIVEGHGGHVWVESTENEGATFRFTWPKRVQSMGSAAETTATTPT
ncbi:MAG: ATP-binding protein [Acidobacteriota bacterium]